jgi:beta-lactam-binding protein with PASTA domain
MDNKFKTRSERKNIEEEIKLNQEKKEQELEKKREELKKILFEDSKKDKIKSKKIDDSKPKIFKKEIPIKPEVSNKNETHKKPTFTNILLSLTFLLSLILFIFLIIDSTNRINQIYEIINAFLILIITISFLISFKKSFFKNKATATSITAILIIIAIVFNGLYLTNIIKLPKQSYLPDFEKKSLTETLKWTEANNIKYDQTFEYSDSTQKYNIINQNEKPNTLTKNIKNLNFIVSRGPDYDKNVIITDMSGWSIDEVMSLINKNYLNNVSVVFEENTDVKKDTLIKQSKTGSMKRSDAIIFTVSLGDKTKLTPIKLKNLKNTPLLDASVYLGRNGITYDLKYEFSDTVLKGNVISASVKTGTTITKDDKITLTISKGKQVKVPELTNKKMSEINKWMIENNIEITYSDKYDDNIKSGRVISSNYKKGDIIEEGTNVSLIFSKGKLIMPKFNNLNDFKNWANEYSVKYEIEEDFDNNIAIGSIIKFSVEAGKSIKADSTITVYVSKGKSIIVPDFTNKTKAEAQKQCNNLSITCTFTESYSKNVTSGKVLSQSLKAGSEMSQNDRVNIVIATANQAKSTSTSSSKTTTNTGGSSSSNNNTTCDKSNTVVVAKQSSLYGTSVQSTLKNYQKAYPGIKFNPVKRASQIGTTGMLHPNMPNRFTANYCDTYDLIIIDNE